MTRVSQLELYNDKDVITQICAMKQMVETGTFAEVRVISTGGNYVFEFEDQNGDVQTFTVPAKQISGVTSSQSGSTVTMRINYNDGSHTDLTWTAGGDVTTNTTQTISAVKTFSVSPIVPTTPSGPTAAINMGYAESTVPGVNNIAHKAGNETLTGIKDFAGTSSSPIIRGKATNITVDFGNPPSTVQYWPSVVFTDSNGLSVGGMNLMWYPSGVTALRIYVKNSDGSTKYILLGQGDVI